MRNIATYALVSLAMLPFWLLLLIGATQIPECESDDGSGPGVACVWHADRHGNGAGDSFIITAEGEVIYI